MDIFNQIKRNTQKELSKEISKCDIVYKILLSKRLIIEHVETLEMCLYDLEERFQKTNYLSGYGALAAAGIATSAALLFKQSAKIVVPAVSSSYLVLFLVKCYNRHKSQQNEIYLKRLIDAIDIFENALKRNLVFLNELEHFKTIDRKNFTDDQFVGTCIAAIKEVIIVLYDALKDLERDYELNEKYSLVYEPIENLCESDYFQKEIEEFSAKNLRSQYLLRLGLIIASGCEDSFVKYNTLNLAPIIDDQTSQLQQNLDLVLFIAAPESKNIFSLKKWPHMKKVPPSLQNAKSFSLSLSSKMVALANECKNLDSSIERLVSDYVESPSNEDSQFQLLPFMKVLEMEMATCQDEFQRLFVTYQKYLNVKPEEEKNSIPTEPNVEEMEALEKVANKESDTASFRDEFFVLDGYQNDNAVEEMPFELSQDEEQLSRKITRRSFKPVLKQLKTKIEPIGEEMKERERRVLQEKGQQFENCDDSSYKNCLSEDSGGESEDEEELRSRRHKKNHNRYNNMRELLTQKAPINIFAFKPSTTVVNEEILE